MIDNSTFTIPWYVALESIRLFQSVLEQSAQEAMIKDSQTYDFFARQFNSCTPALEYYYRRGPIIQDIDVKALPPIFQQCKDEKEVREMNLQIQHALINGLDIEMKEISS